MPETMKKKPSFNIESLRSNIGSNSFKNSKYAKINGWLDTGCYALNRILSGNTRNGIAYGRITMFTGESQTGKSMIAGNAIIDALKKGFERVFVLDTEGGSLYGLIEDSGVDLDKIEQVLIPNAETCTVIILRILDTIENYQKQVPEARFLIVVDSIGALRAAKLMTDALSDKKNNTEGVDTEKGTVVMDMGTTARVVGNMIIATTIPALKTETPVIMLNHVYEKPGEISPSKIKQPGAGKKALYMPRFSVQCSTTLRKADKIIGNSDDDTFFQGNEFTFFCFKNSAVRPFFEAKMMNNHFDPTSTKYYGLFEVAEGYGLIVRESSMYKIPCYSEDKKWYAKDIICGPKSEEIWEKLMPMIDEKSAIDMAFGSTSKAPGLVDDEVEQKKIATDAIGSNSTSHMTLE